jgi:hypothetical protein
VFARHSMCHDGRAMAARPRPLPWLVMEFRPSNGIQECRASSEVIGLDDLRKNLAGMRSMETNNTLLTKPFDIDIDITPRIMGVEIIGLPALPLL